jgi:hypothetical protein
MSVCSTIGDSAPDLAGTNYASRIFHCVASALSREIPPGMPLATLAHGPGAIQPAPGSFFQTFGLTRQILRPNKFADYVVAGSFGTGVRDDQLSHFYSRQRRLFHRTTQRSGVRQRYRGRCHRNADEERSRHGDLGSQALRRQANREVTAKG